MSDIQNVQSWDDVVKYGDKALSAYNTLMEREDRFAKEKLNEIVEQWKEIGNTKEYDDNIVLYPGHHDMTTLRAEKINNPYLQ